MPVPGGAYASLTTPAGANPSWTSAVTIPGANGFPSSSLATTSLSPSVPSGSSAWLSASTPFGGQFGSSQGLSYLSFGATTSQANSTTVLTFASPTPTAGWGFALGDVDAESIQLSATDASGNAIAVSGLGYQGNFNYCAVSPKPSTCTGAGPFTDVPTWNAGTATLAGNGADTSGASGWFMPSVAIKTLTLTYHVLIGIPSAQLWVASNLRTIAGTVTGEPAATVTTPPSTLPSPTTVPVPIPAPVPVPDVVITISDSTGTEIATASSDANGAFSFPTIAPGVYTLSEAAPPGTKPSGTYPITVDVTNGDVTGISLTNVPITIAAAPLLSTTGAPLLSLLGIAVLLIIVGALMVMRKRRRRL